MEQDIPKEAKLILASMIGHQMHFSEGIVGYKDKKDWWFIPAPKNGSGHAMMLGKDGESEFLVTSPLCINKNYCIANDIISEKSQFLVMRIADQYLMQAPLVINPVGCKQIFTDQYTSVSLGPVMSRKHQYKGWRWLK